MPGEPDRQAPAFPSNHPPSVGSDLRRPADAVECGLQDGLEVVGVAAYRVDGDDQVEDLARRRASLLLGDLVRLGLRRRRTGHDGRDGHVGLLGERLGLGLGVDRERSSLKREVLVDLTASLRGGEKRPAGGEHPSAAAVEDEVPGVGLLEELHADGVLAG